MKGKHVLLTIAALAGAGALVYHYAKKNGCSCKSGGGCSCGGAGTATSDTQTGSVPNVPLTTAPSSPTLVSTGLPGMDDMINPDSKWASADGSNFLDPIVDTVNHVTGSPNGVRQFNAKATRVINAAPQKVVLNS